MITAKEAKKFVTKAKHEAKNIDDKWVYDWLHNEHFEYHVRIRANKGYNYLNFKSPPLVFCNENFEKSLRNVMEAHGFELKFDINYDVFQVNW